MPTVSLTPQQQATIDAANNTLSLAKKALDASTLELSNRDQTAHASFNAVMLCSGFKGKTKDFQLLDKSACQTCVSGCKDCGGAGAQQIHTCQSRVAQFNNDYNSWYGYQSTVTAKLADYNAAKENLTVALNAISKDPTTAANTDIINNQINATKSKDMIKWLFFGLTAALIVGAALFIGIKMLGGRNAA